ncbi:hypothetical protein Dimus_022358, partial [Dionaea muscipula]
AALAFEDLLPRMAARMVAEESHCPHALKAARWSAVVEPLPARCNIDALPRSEEAALPVKGHSDMRCMLKAEFFA